MQQNETPLPSSPLPKEQRPPKHKTWLLVAGIAAGAVILFAAFALFFTQLLTQSLNPSPNSNEADLQTPAKLMIGSRPYVYACGLDLEADFKQIFGTTDDSVGTISTTDALPSKNVTADSGDLLKIAPTGSTRPVYNGRCSFTGAKEGAAKVTSIEVKLGQYDTVTEAKKAFDNAKSWAAGDFGGSGSTTLSALPSFAGSSFIKPDTGGELQRLEATVLEDSYHVTVIYDFRAPETREAVTSLVGEFARAIQIKLKSAKKGNAPHDLTGHATFREKKFVDVCLRTDMAKLSDAYDDIQFRPDRMIDISTYGSLEGSRASQDGVLSSCSLYYNTPGDRQAAKTAEANSKKRTSLTSDQRWPHTLLLETSSYRTAQEAQEAYANKKAQASKSFSLADVQNVGDAAYALHQEQTHSTANQGSGVNTEDSYVILSDSDVIVINTQQASVAQPFQTIPVEITETRVKKAYRLIADALQQNQ